MMKTFACFLAVALAIAPATKINAQMNTQINTQMNVQTEVLPSPGNAEQLLKFEEPSVIVVRREVIPGVVTFTRQNGCLLQNPVSRNFLNNGMTLETPIRLAASGNSLPRWRNEYRKPWQSALTDYEGGEQKIMFLQIGKHPSTLIRVSESDEKMLEAETACATAAYKIFGSNLRLLKPIPEQRHNNLSVSLSENWVTSFPVTIRISHEQPSKKEQE
jgi:hypothetical protein